jgi:uncharacterized RDD family membrane protein YckC
VIDYTLSGVIAVAVLVAVMVVGIAVSSLVGDFPYQEDEDQARTVATGIAIIVAILVSPLYFWVGNSWGGTPGKRMVGLSVVDARHGGEIGLGRGLARLIVWFIGAVPLYLGWLWSIWDGKKQAWHDKAASSVVVARSYADRYRRPWYRGWVPLAAVGVTACLAIGIIGGLTIGFTVERDANARLSELFDDASDAYLTQAERQANIDTLYDPCSSDWTDETAVNSTRSLQSLVGLRDYANARDEIRASVEQFCNDADIGAYCAAYAVAVVRWAAQEDIEKRPVEKGCIDLFERSFATEVIEVGDCILYVGDSYRIADCSSPHDAKVIAVFDMPVEGDGYPGDEVVDDYAYDNCPVDTETYLYPTADTWSLGDRQIACAAEEP